MEKPFSWKYELRSKLMDGVLPGVALYLLVMMLAMAAGPIRAIVGGSGFAAAGGEPAGGGHVQPEPRAGEFTG